MDRLDIVLVQRGFAESRLQAKRLIFAGAVQVNNNSNLKPGQRIPPDAEIEVEHPPKYVSRGGLKLEKALQDFDITVKNKVAIDVGASTGGFTDCLLQHGVDFVYAVDVGYGQLAWKLRKNPRVHVLDKTNIRYIDPHLFSHPLDIAVIDVSFISLQKVLPVVIEKLGVSEIIALVKPQFEAGRNHVKKGGIVDNPDVHKVTLGNLIEFVQQNLAVIPFGLTFSPIHQDIGNIEYLLWLRKSTTATQFESGLEILTTIDTDFVSDVVNSAHDAFYANSVEKSEQE
ncbi:MAG: TlyA family RNA methyltransferase [Candidatus Poribacteria bacterium]|nr:TlyA family RNA methyltransferase [Candidatus Poribacteria bacterium]